jgi:hypothetical protein
VSRRFSEVQVVGYVKVGCFCLSKNGLLIFMYSCETFIPLSFVIEPSMLNAVMHNLRRLDPIHSFINSPRAPRCLFFSRGFRTASQAQTRRRYINVAATVACVSSIVGLTLYAVNSGSFVPTICPDSGNIAPTESDEGKGLSETDEPPEDFTTSPPFRYTQSWWEPSFTQSLEEHLNLESRIFKVDSPCGVPRYDTSVVGK